MGCVKNRQFWDSKRFNSAKFMRYYIQLTQLAISMFEWKGLPDTVEERLIELSLFADGKAIWFKDDMADEQVCCRCLIGPGIDRNYNPIKRTAYGGDSYRVEGLDNKNSVIIWNNVLRTNSMLEVELFSKTLSDIDRAIDVNVNAQKTPILIQCPENQRLSVKKAYQEYEDNSLVIYADSSMNPDAFKVLKTDAPFTADKLYELKIQYWNEILTTFGISNINTQKKERMITDEVTRNLGSTFASRYPRLNARQTACNEINKMFGLSLSCEYREDFDRELLEMPDGNNGGFEEDEDDG